MFVDNNSPRSSLEVKGHLICWGSNFNEQHKTNSLVISQRKHTNAEIIAHHREREKITYYKIEDNSLKTSEVFAVEVVEEGGEGTV
jgi:hypothetical protein